MLDASVPQEEPLQPAPLKPQITAVFEVPVTLAVKSCIPALGTEALAGLMLNKTAEPPVVGGAGVAIIGGLLEDKPPQPNRTRHRPDRARRGTTWESLAQDIGRSHLQV